MDSNYFKSFTVKDLRSIISSFGFTKINTHTKKPDLIDILVDYYLDHPDAENPVNVLNGTLIQEGKQEMAKARTEEAQTEESYNEIIESVVEAENQDNMIEEYYENPDDIPVVEEDFMDTQDKVEACVLAEVIEPFDPILNPNEEILTEDQVLPVVVSKKTRKPKKEKSVKTKTTKSKTTKKSKFPVKHRMIDTLLTDLGVNPAENVIYLDGNMIYIVSKEFLDTIINATYTQDVDILKLLRVKATKYEGIVSDSMISYAKKYTAGILSTINVCDSSKGDVEIKVENNLVNGESLVNKFDSEIDSVIEHDLIPISREEFNTFIKAQYSLRNRNDAASIEVRSGLPIDIVNYILDHYRGLSDKYIDVIQQNRPRIKTSYGRRAVMPSYSSEGGEN